MIPRPSVKDISKDDVDALLGVEETATLEFKRDETVKNDTIAAECCAFANFRGGDLVFGVDEDEHGIASEIVGLTPGTRIDDFIQRVESVARDGIDPPVTWVQCGAIRIGDGRHVVVARVSRSRIGPHRANKQRSHFYSKGNRTRYHMDVEEIRRAFLETDGVPARLRAFVEDRIGLVLRGQGPVNMAQGPVLFLHIVPESALLSSCDIDLENAGRFGISPLGGHGGGATRFDVDGFVFFEQPNVEEPFDPETTSYTELFRDGRIEAASSRLIRPDRHGRPVAFGLLIEEALCRALVDASRAYKNSGIEPPIYVSVSANGVAGYALKYPPNYYYLEHTSSIRRNEIRFPAVVVRELSFDRRAAAAALRPAFDALWRSAGAPCSPNFDPDSGEWHGRA